MITITLNQKKKTRKLANLQNNVLHVDMSCILKNYKLNLLGTLHICFIPYKT